MEDFNFMGLTEEEARELFEEVRWPDGVRCPRCQGRDIVRIQGKSARAGLYRCRICRRDPDQKSDQFTVTVDTVLECTKIGLRFWIQGFHLMSSSKKGVSAHQLHRMMGITYKSAWHMAHRIRHAMREEQFQPFLKGKVEVDETYVGGKSRKGVAGRGSERKTPVVAMVERDGRIQSHPVDRVNSKNLKGAIRENVDRASTIYTDEFLAYQGIGREFRGGHKVVNHSRKEYVRGDAHTNTAESYFALLKRGIHGTFHSVSRQHLHRYCDEFNFRWNHRRSSDRRRTITAIRQASGKRLAYYHLSSK